jgi:hypothetical protein
MLKSDEDRYYSGTNPDFSSWVENLELRHGVRVFDEDMTAPLKVMFDLGKTTEQAADIIERQYSTEVP